MTKHETFRKHKVVREDRADGTVLLRSGYELAPVADTSADWLHHWASERPDGVFLAERQGAGWRALHYGETLQMVRALAASLLARGLNAATPILILSGNGVDHGLLTLAAHYVGIPTVPVAEQYSLIPGAQKQLQYILGLIRPRMVYAADGEKFATALAMQEMAGLDVVVSDNAAPGQALFDDLLRGDSTDVDVDGAAARVGPDSVVKILMTSGSTSNPKGVLTSHRMMCANQAQYDGALPFMDDHPPRLVDWLPWNHVFGGSNNFNMVLANGGSLYIDAGKPAPALIGQTIENIMLVSPTIAFNVPVGFALLRDAMRSDAALKQAYFQDLDMIFYAGASLPQDIWQDLVAMAAEVRGDAPMMSTCWGMTETAPAAIFQHEPSPLAGIVGVPLPGLVAKLVPDEGTRYEVRVKGPNITPGYFRDDARTAAAFDEEGFFISGDAMTFVDPDDAGKGLRFDGRISEDFKLATGIWVRATALRLQVLVALAPLVADVIVTGEGRAEVGLLILPAPDLMAGGALSVDGDACLSDALMGDIAARLARLGETAAGSSNRIARALIMSEPALMAEGEITAKGNLNFYKLLKRRARVLQRLYRDDDPAVIQVY
jgi:feruloyl-CoA synthase